MVDVTNNNGLKFIGTKKLRGQVCQIIGRDDKNVYVQSLTYPHEPILKLPIFYFVETFKEIKNNQTRLPTVLDKDEVEDIMIVLDQIFRKAEESKLIEGKISNHLLNVITFNLINIFGNFKK